MGDIADMMLDGTLDEETGEYIGDYCKQKYGTESPGFPVSQARVRQLEQDLEKATSRLESLHYWFLKCAPDSYKGCRLYIDVVSILPSNEAT